MCAFATGGFHGMAYVVESEWGTTPTTPDMTMLRLTGSNLGLSKDSFESAELRNDRQVVDVRTGNKQVQGDINFELSYGFLDDVLEGVMFGEWTLDELKAGTTKKFFTFERQFTDVAQYFAFKGCMIQSFSLDIKPNAVITGGVSVIGKDMVTASSPLDATPIAAPGHSPFDSFSGVLNEGGSPIAVVTSLDFKLENGIEPAFVIGSNTAAALIAGRTRITGNLSAYFENLTLFNKFLNETPTSLDFDLTDGTRSYNFSFPNVKYTGADLPVDGEGGVVMSMPWQAIYDASEATSIVITRSAS